MKLHHQPGIVTADQDVLLGFHRKLFGATEIFRVPAVVRGPLPGGGP
ncbi:hypothetical protein ACFPK5_06610 [Streptomyces beijiangensis]